MGLETDHPTDHAALKCFGGLLQDDEDITAPPSFYWFPSNILYFLVFLQHFYVSILDVVWRLFAPKNIWIDVKFGVFHKKAGHQKRSELHFNSVIR